MLLRSLRMFKLRPSLLSTTPTCSLATKARELDNASPQFTTLKPAELQPNTPSRLAGKEFLPGSTGNGFPEVLSPPTETFPHAVRVEAHSVDDCIRSCRRYLKENLSHYGAVLLRNLPLKTAADFSGLCQRLGYKGMTYQGGAVEREELDRSSGTYTASDEPPQAVIEHHNEMAYSPVYPSKVIKQTKGQGVGGSPRKGYSTNFVTEGSAPTLLYAISDRKGNLLHIFHRKWYPFYTLAEEILLP